MTNPKRVELAIIGGGIGGIATAIWASRLEISCRLFEASEKLGGQLHWIYKEIPDYPGVTGQDGPALAASLHEQLRMLQLSVDLKSCIRYIEPDRGEIRTETETWQASAIVIATGLTRRKLLLPASDAWEGRGLFYTAHGQRDAILGKTVAILGGGDGAFENALFLADHAPAVFVLLRNDTLRARLDLIEAARRHPRIHLLFHTHLQEILGSSHLEALRLSTPQGSRLLPIQALLVKIGFQPQTHLLSGLCDLDPQGYLRVSPFQKTSALRLWAVGDICTPLDPSLSASVGQASIAARDIKRFLREQLL